MNKEEKNKYAYELMVKNNPEEAVKNLMLLDKLQERFNNLVEEYKDRTDTIHDLFGRIDKAISYAEANQERLGVWNHLVKEIVKILKGVKDD